MYVCVRACLPACVRACVAMPYVLSKIVQCVRACKLFSIKYINYNFKCTIVYCVLCICILQC